MWLSADPAMGEYIPQAPVNDDIRKQNQNLLGMGGVFNYVNLHAYHYVGNNPVKLTDPDGKISFLVVTGAIGVVAGAIVGGAYGAYKSYSEAGEIDWGRVGKDALIGGNKVNRFGSQMIHNARNIVRISHGAETIHAKLSGYYSSIQGFTGGLTVRAWISTQSFDQQYNFGMGKLTEFAKQCNVIIEFVK
jgi:hypothetical protein